jgi:hypothetical protein
MTNRSHSSNFAVYLHHFPHALDIVVDSLGGDVRDCRRETVEG